MISVHCLSGGLGGREGASVQGGIPEAKAGGAGGLGVGRLGGAGGPGEGAQEDGGEEGRARHLGRRGREGLHGGVPQEIFIGQFSKLLYSNKNTRVLNNLLNRYSE